MTSVAGASQFQPTMWSVVLRARDAADPNRATALNRLCETYWKPIYVYLRRKGFSIEDAKDATQGFFASFLEQGAIDRVEQGRGRFKGYLLAHLEHFLANEYRRERAEKRGGGAAVLSLDFAGAETEVRLEPADLETPEIAYRRSWAVIVLHNAFDALRREFSDSGRPQHFDAVRLHLSAAPERASYEDLAKRLGMPVTDVTNLLHRSRKRLREIIRANLRETVESENDIDDELRDIFASIS